LEKLLTAYKLNTRSFFLVSLGKTADCLQSEHALFLLGKTLEKLLTAYKVNTRSFILVRLGKTADRLQSEHALFLLGKEYKLTHLGEEHLILKVLHQIKGR
jgi:hypothetical protein